MKSTHLKINANKDQLFSNSNRVICLSSLRIQNKNKIFIQNKLKKYSKFCSMFSESMRVQNCDSCISVMIT